MMRDGVMVRRRIVDHHVPYASPCDLAVFLAGPNIPYVRLSQGYAKAGLIVDTLHWGLQTIHRLLSDSMWPVQLSRPFRTHRFQLSVPIM